MNTLLIANRGEIALRIMRTANAMGIRTVAVYSDADRDALHVRAADAAAHIGPAAPAQSYLNIAALVAAARASGADAVHPGYGFLAENADFAQAVLDAGLVFVGPPPAAIRAMAHKAGAKRLMAEAGVPCVPGYSDGAQDDATLVAEARRIGFPVMIKAAAGGGGRGMRRVGNEADLADALRAARSEALNAFGDGELILERAIDAPRHVEIQVFADTHGHVVHLGERDCSVQRRHQKLIEEAPSPAVSPALRTRMGEVAVNAARSIGYVGAGTLEFLLERDGTFHFMEMNTRLQVEHAVTEAIAGVDLVEWQLRVARREPLPLAQAAIDARLAAGGHAIEVRLCAEDPERDFLPQSGRVASWQRVPGVRVDTALESGATIPPHYDSMVAKLVAHGSTREEALDKLQSALLGIELLGVRTNRRFLADCLEDPVFVAGEATTDFVATRMPAERRATPEPDAKDFAVAAALHCAGASAGSLQRVPDELRGWSNGLLAPTPVDVTLDGTTRTVAVRAKGESWIVGPVRVDLELETGCATVDGSRVLFKRVEDWIRLDSLERACTTGARRTSGTSGGPSDGSIRSPITGRIVAVTAAPGDAVVAGQTVAVVEAMKMEHALTASRAGRVEQVHVAVGDSVAAGACVAVIG